MGKHTKTQVETMMTSTHGLERERGGREREREEECITFLFH